MIAISGRDGKEDEYRLRLEAEAESDDDARDDPAGPAQRSEQQSLWVDIQLRQAMRRGDFDNLPGAGKPIPGIDGPHDPDWWLKSLIERERITGVLPPALALRTEDAQLDDLLDRETTPNGVRRIVDDFNARIVEARRQLQGGPPVITPLRDAEREIGEWEIRRRTHVARQKALLEQLRREQEPAVSPSWWRRVLGRLLDRMVPSRRRLI
ncbi:DUF1992 domain-containing protein [Aeromicrobium sp.]|uniref:DnaJ family domain-containing protein n=1 Tax=Aeromicrobium sp. TaxID=1871063 RepID=UPI0025BAD18A|nr:DUF1992 domain-containing protein [Aeromicrobium sp.]